ncbi:hypothetical protein B296_00017937, partial [Ensete ventricosum]
EELTMDDLIPVKTNKVRLPTLITTSVYCVDSGEAQTSASCKHPWVARNVSERTSP